MITEHSYRALKRARENYARLLAEVEIPSIVDWVYLALTWCHGGEAELSYERIVPHLLDLNERLKKIEDMVPDEDEGGDPEEEMTAITDYHRGAEGPGVKTATEVTVTEVTLNEREGR